MSGAESLLDAYAAALTRLRSSSPASLAHAVRVDDLRTCRSAVLAAMGGERPLPVATAPHDGRYVRVLVRSLEDGRPRRAVRLLDDGPIGWTIGFNDHDLWGEGDDAEASWKVVGREWNAHGFVQTSSVRVLGWLPADWLNEGHGDEDTDAVLAWIDGGAEPPRSEPRTCEGHDP